MAGRLIVCGLMLVLASFWNGQALDIHIGIDPDNYNMMTTEQVTISCATVEEDDTGIENISAINIVKDNKPVVAIGKDNNIFFTHNDTRYKAEGDIDTDINNSYLTLTLMTLYAQDSGEYTCVVVYYDANAKANLTAMKSEHLTVSVEDSLYYLKDMMTVYEEQIGDLNKKVTNLESLSQNFTYEIGNLTQRVPGFNATAFSVTAPHEFEPPMGSTLILSKVIMQIGEGYDVKTGVFTAPTHGLYAFHLAAMTIRAGTWVSIYIKVNDDNVAKLYAHDAVQVDQSFVAAVVSLKPGQKVLAEVSASGGSHKLNSHLYTVFSGYLVQQYF